MFVLVARWPPPSTMSHILFNQAMASGNEGQGHLLIGCRCGVFDGQEGNALSAGACQLSSCSEPTCTRSSTLAFCAQKLKGVVVRPRASLLRPRTFHDTAPLSPQSPRIYWWSYANILQWRDQKEGNGKMSESMPTYRSSWWSYRSSLTWYPWVALSYVHKQILDYYQHNHTLKVGKTLHMIWNK